jgi:biopolymer transport protein ExbD
MEDKKQIKEINASSMADIAFLLLIFFLVATTMNVDTGITRMLPPIPPEEMKAEDLQVRQRNLMYVKVTKFNTVTVSSPPGGGVVARQIDVSQLKDIVKGFITNPSAAENLPERELADIELPDGSVWAYPVSKGIVSLQNDRETSYDLYIQVQNELTRALNEMRNDVARQKFNRDMSQLSEEETGAITKAVPTSISEADVADTGGN